jgi:O-antigen ligase
VAHNSFIHAYVELGLFGGALFLAAFIYAVWMLLSLNRTRPDRGVWSLADCRPIVVAMVAGYGAGAYSLSRNYVIPTYLCLGMVTSYLSLTIPDPPTWFQVSQKWIARIVAIGVGGLLFFKLFTQYAGVFGL